MKNSDMPASPMFDSYGLPKRSFNKEDISKCIGLTKREAFAMAAMQGFLSDSNVTGSQSNVAAACVQMADAILAELDK